MFTITGSTDRHRKRERKGGIREAVVRSKYLQLLLHANTKELSAKQCVIHIGLTVPQASW